MGRIETKTDKMIKLWEKKWERKRAKEDREEKQMNIYRQFSYLNNKEKKNTLTALNRAFSPLLKEKS